MYTYLFKDSAFYKIGRSENVLRRFREMDCYNPTIKIISCVNKDVENNLHKIYKKK